MKILVIEQEKIIAEDITKTLKKMKHDVVTVSSSSKEALSSFFVFGPEIIVSDTRLESRFGGIEFALKIQNFKLTPIVFITPEEIDLINEKSKDLKYFSLIQMPFSEKEIIQNVELTFYHYQAEKFKDKIEERISKASDIDAKHIIENNKGNYVSLSRIEEMKILKVPNFDLTKLVKLCEELNFADLNECYFSIGMLVRSIIDHIPPLFEKKTFSELVNNYKGDKSFKGLMQHLDKSQRSIADRYLHSQISKKEVSPNFHQIDFKAALDVLLSEIIKIYDT